MTKKCGYKIKRILNVGFANGSPDSPPLLTRSFIYLKNKQIEVIHENSKNLNQTKLIFRHALGNARYRGDVQVRRCRLLDRRVSIVAGGFGRCRNDLRYAVGCVYAGSGVRLGI